jgi:hypothetical protein
VARLHGYATLAAERAAEPPATSSNPSTPGSTGRRPAVRQVWTGKYADLADLGNNSEAIGALV